MRAATGPTSPDCNANPPEIPDGRSRRWALPLFLLSVLLVLLDSDDRRGRPSPVCGFRDEPSVVGLGFPLPGLLPLRLVACEMRGLLLLITTFGGSVSEALSELVRLLRGEGRGPFLLGISELATLFPSSVLGEQLNERGEQSGQTCVRIFNLGSHLCGRYGRHEYGCLAGGLL